MMDIFSLFIGAAIGGVISWLITSIFHNKSSKEQETRIAKLTSELKRTNTIEYFEHLLTFDVWDKEFVGEKEIWISKQNSTFIIKTDDNDKEFIESWAEGFPDKSCTKFSVYLTINGEIVKELVFISLDGGRITVPLPERLIVEGEPIYFWDTKAISFKVGKIIGTYYIYEDIEGVAKRCGVEMLKINHKN